MVDVTPMEDPKVVNNASGERTITQDLFASEDEKMSTNPAGVESVPESPPGKETEKMALFTTSSSRTTGDEKIPYPVEITATAKVPVDSRNFMQQYLITGKNYRSKSTFEDVGWVETLSL